MRISSEHEPARFSLDFNDLHLHGSRVRKTVTTQSSGCHATPTKKIIT